MASPSSPSPSTTVKGFIDVSYPKQGNVKKPPTKMAIYISKPYSRMSTEDTATKVFRLVSRFTDGFASLDGDAVTMQSEVNNFLGSSFATLPTGTGVLGARLAGH